jgi:hypothetical protein
MSNFDIPVMGLSDFMRGLGPLQKGAELGPFPRYLPWLIRSAYFPIAFVPARWQAAAHSRLLAQICTRSLPISIYF